MIWVKTHYFRMDSHDVDKYVSQPKHDKSAKHAAKSF